MIAYDGRPMLISHIDMVAQAEEFDDEILSGYVDDCFESESDSEGDCDIDLGRPDSPTLGIRSSISDSDFDCSDDMEFVFDVVCDSNSDEDVE